MPMYTKGRRELGERERESRMRSAMGKKGVPDWLNSSLWSSPSSSSPSPAPPDTVKPSPSSSPRVPVPECPPRLPSPTPPPPPPPPPPPRATEPEDVAHDPVSPHFSPEEISRQSLLLAELSKKVVNLVELRRLASQGIPDGAGIRPTVWKLLLGYLPDDRALWAQELSKKRSQYKAFKDEFLVNPSEITRRMDESSGSRSEDLETRGSGFLQRLEITHGEHPLSLGKMSVWNQFFQDTEILEQIDRDVKRTHPDMHFFSGDSPFAKSNQEALKHILIIFAKLNPGIRYVQGMNEVLAPLFYVFRNDPDESNAIGLDKSRNWGSCPLPNKPYFDFSMAPFLSLLCEFKHLRHGLFLLMVQSKYQASAEADAFFCFVELLSGFRDNFCQKLDNSVVGIRSTITRLSELLKKHDGELWRHLEVTTKVNPQFYAFRWITLLLTQEFNFADSLHIWDTLLSDPEGPQETLLRICCAMLILVRRRLLAGDFTSNLKLLQNYPSTNISHLLYVANKLHGSSSG